MTQDRLKFALLRALRRLATACSFGVVLLLSPASPAQEAGASDPGEAAQRVELRGGQVLIGTILKRTQKAIFLDLGYTVLSLPADEVASVTAVEESASGSPLAAELREDESSIFVEAPNLRPGTIEEKSAEVGEGVVQILCLGKSGSGFIVDGKGGYVVTNFHVVEREQNISLVVFVREPTGLRRVKLESVRIVALNPFFDLALLKVEDTRGVELRTVHLGRYRDVRVGDPVFAIGSPLGLDRTVSEGIVSNRNRAVSGMLSIQTTTPINPGNSGGPLFNVRGEVIGVTNMKIAFADNLGFAIPVHYLKDFLRNRDAHAYDKDNPNNGIRYLPPPTKDGRDAESGHAPEAAATPADGESAAKKDEKNTARF